MRSVLAETGGAIGNAQVRRSGALLAIGLVLGAVFLLLPDASTAAETGSISGKVTNNAAQPLEDVCVDVHHSNGGLIEEELTGPDGRYTVTQLENRNYKVEFYDCGDNNVAGEFYNNKTTFNAANPVTVSGGSATTSINAVLGPAGSISGTVTDGSAQPLVDICVDVYDLEEDLVDVSYTEEDGTYTVGGLSSGYHKVEFTDCGDHNVASEYYNNKSTFESANPVAVAAGVDTSGINASLDSGGSISGTVTGTSGGPLADICVDAYDSTGEESGFGYTEPDGSYSVEGLASGNHRLEFSDCGENNVASEFYDNKDQLASANPVNVSAGAEVTGIDAILASGGSISGKVTNTNSKPLADICVDAYDSNGIPNGSGYTEADGTYLIEALASGKHRVKFYDCGSNKVASEFYKNKSNLSEATRIAVTAGSTTSGINASLAPQGGGNGKGGGGNGGGGKGNGGGNGGGNGDNGGNLGSIKAKVIGPRVLKKGRRKAYKVKVGIRGSMVAKGLKLKVKGRGVRSKKAIGKIAPGRIKKVKVKIRPKKAGKSRLTFKIVSRNVGRKIIKKKVKVRR